MRAITIDDYKAQPQLQEMPRPQPGEGELLIRLHSTGVNPMDWRARLPRCRSATFRQRRTAQRWERWC